MPNPDPDALQGFRPTHRICLSNQGNKTVVRGSYGIFYYNAGALGGASGQGLSTLGYSASPYFTTLNGGITPAFDWDSGFPAYAHATVL